jgi:hypothetical protein
MRFAGCTLAVQVGVVVKVNIGGGSGYKLATVNTF